jgi:hypothetical protein
MFELLQPWIAALLLSVAFYLLFRNRIFGIADPLFLFLVIRVAAGLAFLPYTSEFYEDAYYSALAVVSTAVLVLIVWLEGSGKPESSLAVSHETNRHLLNSGAKLLFLKLILVLAVFQQLPIFMDKGSDSYIDFDVENKLVSSFLLGINYVDVFLLSFVLPLLVEKKEKYSCWILLLLSICVSIVNFKKSTILMILLTVLFADNVRRHYYGDKVGRLLSGRVLAVGGLLGFGWMAAVFQYTISEYEVVGVNEILNFVVSIFSQPYTVLLSHDFHAFAESYEVNRVLYFFHTFTSSVFNLPAFSASIGPAFNEYQTGFMTGHGINPTYLLEGFVLLGPMLLPVYAAAVGFVLCLVRFYLVNSGMRMESRIVLIGLLFPALYTLPVDALLAAKMVMVIVLILGINFVFEEIRYATSGLWMNLNLYLDD